MQRNQGCYADAHDIFRAERRLILYLLAAQLVPVKRLREALFHLHGVSLSQGMICSVLRRAAARHAGFWRHLRGGPAANGIRIDLRLGDRLFCCPQAFDTA